MACYDASLLNSTASANSTASDPQLGNITAPTDPNAVPSPTSTSTTLWWTPSVTAWWTPASATDAALPAATSAPVKRLRRFINFLVKRADSVPSYSYGDVDENGELGVNVADAITTLTDGTTTGLDSKCLVNLLRVHGLVLTSCSSATLARCRWFGDRWILSDGHCRPQIERERQ